MLDRAKADVVEAAIEGEGGEDEAGVGEHRGKTCQVKKILSGVGRLKFSGELKIPKNVKEDFFLQKIFPFLRLPLHQKEKL